MVPKVEEKIEETPVINKKTVTKEVPPINYVMIISAILALIIITFFLAKTFGMTTKKDITKSYLVTNQIVSNELTKDNIDSAINKDKSFVLLTTLNNEEEYNLEKELRGIIEANHLKDNFYVFNNDTNTNVDLNNTFKLDGKSIKYR